MGLGAGARERRSLSIGVVVPSLEREGGAERLALHCIRHWQERHLITLYSARSDEALLERHGVAASVARRTLASQLEPGATAGGLERRILEGVLLPRIWTQEIGEHDVYVGHQWPTHRIDRHPLVWYAHEGLRFAYDLRRERPSPLVEQELASLLEEDGALRADLRHETAYGLLRDLDASARPDRIVANSRLTAGELARAFGRSDVDVVYPGVELESALEPTWEDPCFLLVGSLLLHKRQRLAIEAISLIEGARLVVVGRGPRGPELARIAEGLGVADRVEIRSDVGDTELRQLRARCRGVVLTSVREPFGLVALEALAAGKPLVAVDEGGFTECVDASCALLVPPEPAALARALGRLAARPDEAERLGRAGRKLAQSFPWTRTALELEAILVEAVTAAGAREASPRPRDEAFPARPRIGVCLLADHGEGIARGRWRRPREDGRPPSMPRAGYYASHHESTLRRQLAEIEGCGFDFVVLAFGLTARGLDVYGAETLRQALALAPELGHAARFAVEIDVAGASDALLERALDWLAAVLARAPAALRPQGRPLVLLRGLPAGARAPERAALDLRTLPAAESGSLRWLAARDEARLARELHGAASDPSAELIVVASWNDHAGGDPIEPSRDHGDERLARLGALVREIRQP